MYTLRRVELWEGVFGCYACLSLEVSWGGKEDGGGGEANCCGTGGDEESGLLEEGLGGGEVWHGCSKNMWESSLIVVLLSERVVQCARAEI